MSKEALSQAEIDALLKSLHDDTPIAPVINDAERNALAQFANILFAPGAEQLTTMLASPTSVEVARVHATSLRAIGDEVPGRSLVAPVSFGGALSGAAFFVLEESAVATVASRVEGLPGSAELGDRQMASAASMIGELAAAGADALSAHCGTVEVAIGEIMVKDLGVTPLTDDLLPDDLLLAITLRWQIGDLVDTQIQLVLEQGFADTIATVFAPPKPAPAAPARRTGGASVKPPTAASRIPTEPFTAPTPSPARPAKAAPPVTVQRAEFGELPRHGTVETGGNIDLLLDVPLSLTVELGRTKKTIREILSLGPGSVVELEKLAGETVDILVGGKLIAKGEVVVIDENFAVRITDIISPVDRLNSLR
jgi:flagellar motor switch protein FliN/FliY